jgi:hypothetical protein
VRTRYADREPIPSLFPPSETFTRGMSGIDTLSHPCSKQDTFPTTTREKREAIFVRRRFDTHSHVAVPEQCETIGADVRRLSQQCSMTYIGIVLIQRKVKLELIEVGIRHQRVLSFTTRHTSVNKRTSPLSNRLRTAAYG